jgi:hypothetical protein
MYSYLGFWEDVIASRNYTKSGEMKTLHGNQRNEMSAGYLLLKETAEVPFLYSLRCTPAIYPFSIYHIYHISRAVFIIKV